MRKIIIVKDSYPLFLALREGERNEDRQGGGRMNRRQKKYFDKTNLGYRTHCGSCTVLCFPMTVLNCLFGSCTSDEKIMPIFLVLPWGELLEKRTSTFHITSTPKPTEIFSFNFWDNRCGFWILTAWFVQMLIWVPAWG